MAPTRYRFTASMWLWKDENSWWFVTLPDDVSDDIEERHGASAGGFGSIKVEVTVGSTTWRTSLFPSTEQRAYVLPMKKGRACRRGAGGGRAVPGQLGVRVRLNPH